MSIVMGVDPGLAHMGWGILQLHKTTEKVLALGVIVTEKSTKKLNVLASDDNLRRARELYRALMLVVSKYEPAAIAIEAKSYPRNASAAAKTSMSWGVLASISESLNLPVCQASPQRVKKCLTGKIKSEKEEVQEALNNKFGTQILLDAGIEGIKKSDREHPYDALAVAVTCLDSDLIRLLRNR